jgi:hypothetical protein
MNYNNMDYNINDSDNLLIALIFVLIGEFLNVLNTLDFLQGSAYIFTILIGIDTLTGNLLKKNIKMLINKLKTKIKW